jgi:hypothetical protein
MSEEQLEQEVLRRVAFDRRSFVKRVVLGTSFAVPVVASFQMDALTMNSASAGFANQIDIGIDQGNPTTQQSTQSQSNTQSTNQNVVVQQQQAQQQGGAGVVGAAGGQGHGSVSRRVFFAGPQARRRAFLVRDTRLAATGSDAWLLGLAGLGCLVAGAKLMARRVAATTPDNRK